MVNGVRMGELSRGRGGGRLRYRASICGEEA